MGKITLGGCLTSLKRSFTNSYIGFVKGSVTHLKNNGEMQVLLENDHLVCYSVGLDDVVIKKDDVATYECVGQTRRDWGNNNIKDCTVYAVTFKNGEVGSFTIWLDKATDFLQFLKK